MAFTAANLVNLYAGPLGSGWFHYDASSDTMATVAAAGYFNNTTYLTNLGVDDYIQAQCSDGDLLLRVASLSSGSVTTNVASNEGPYNSAIGSSVGTVSVGVTEIGTGTATAHTLAAAPYIGAKITVTQMGTATGGITVTTSSVGVGVNPQGNRIITFTGQGQSVQLLGVSTTRWVVTAANGVTYS